MMGWRSREWARWSDEERERFLGPSAAVTIATRGVDRVRLVVWGSLGAAILLLAVGALAARALLPPLPPPAAASAGARVIYGWSDIPSITSPTPGTRVVRIGADPVICTTRTVVARRWLCTAYGLIRPGMRVVELPPSYPDEFAPCSTPTAPGGRIVPCPGTGDVSTPRRLGEAA
jgi:hypothetical protein